MLLDIAMILHYHRQHRSMIIRVIKWYALINMRDCYDVVLGLLFYGVQEIYFVLAIGKIYTKIAGTWSLK